MWWKVPAHLPLTPPEFLTSWRLAQRGIRSSSLLHPIGCLLREHATFLQGHITGLDTAIAEQIASVPHPLETISDIAPVFAGGIVAEIASVLFRRRLRLRGLCFPTDVDNILDDPDDGLKHLNTSANDIVQLIWHPEMSKGDGCRSRSLVF
jgi:hypothetical protein